MKNSDTDSAILFWLGWSVLAPTFIVCIIFLFGDEYFIYSIQYLIGSSNFFNSSLLEMESIEERLLIYIYIGTLPLNVLWISFTVWRSKLFNALRSVALKNLSTGVWNPAKYSLNGGRMRFAVGAVMFSALFFGSVLIENGPSFCRECESGVFGILIFRVLVSQLMLVAIFYVAGYSFLWKSICYQLGLLNAK